jgi:protein-disulfide isomerase
MKKDNAIIAIIAVAVLAFAGGYLLNKPKTAPQAAPTDVKAPEAAPSAAVGANLPSMGPANAKVTIIEISDFQCPFCSRAKATLDELHKEYPNDVRIVFVHQPLSFHPNARPSAIASMAAHKQGKFWEMYDKLFANQRELSDDNYKKWAKEIGLDMAKFEADLKDAAIGAGVDRDQQVANALGASGTPAFFINGVNLSGAQPKEEFKKIIDAQIQKANDEIGKGAKVEELNEKLTRANNPAQGEQIIGLVFKGGTPPAGPAKAAQDKPRKPPEDDKTVWKVELHGDEPSKGPADALITIVEFTDFQCPFCGKARASLDEVEKNYGDKVRVVFKNLPLDFHKNAFGAAEAALCAKDQGKFWDMEKRLFSNQGELDADKLPGHAKEVGLDVGKFEACMKARTYKAHIEKDMATAEKITATGTPAFFIMGRKIGGARPFEDFKKIIDEELPKAEAKVSAGTAKKDVYAASIKEGKENIPPPPLDTKVAQFDYNGSPHLGPKNAPVKIVEFKDFQCPFCARVIPALKQVQKESNGKVAVVFKHYPLSSQCNKSMPRDMHPAACLAAYWSMAAEEQGKFWEFEDVVFQNFQTMMPSDANMSMDDKLKAQGENLKKFAKDVGMDVAKAEAYVAAKKYAARLDKDMAEAGSAGVRGTPALYINGRQYNGPMKPDKMAKTIQLLLDGKL